MAGVQRAHGRHQRDASAGSCASRQPRGVARERCGRHAGLDFILRRSSSALGRNALELAKLCLFGHARRPPAQSSRKAWMPAASAGMTRNARIDVNFPHEQRPHPGAGFVQARDRGLPRQRARARPGGDRRQTRPADLRARRHHEPAADLGHRLRAARPTCSARRRRSAGSISSWSISAGSTECRASGWVPASDKLAALMARHRLPRRPHPDRQGARRTPARSTRVQRVQALVFVGDAMEEKIDELCAAAGELGLLGVPVFMFQEGDDADRRKRLSRDRAALARRLLPLRYRRRARARRIAARGRRLCRRRPQGARGPCRRAARGAAQKLLAQLR